MPISRENRQIHWDNYMGGVFETGLVGNKWQRLQRSFVRDGSGYCSDVEWKHPGQMDQCDFQGSRRPAGSFNKQQEWRKSVRGKLFSVVLCFKVGRWSHAMIVFSWPIIAVTSYWGFVPIPNLWRGYLGSCWKRELLPSSRRDPRVAPRYRRSNNSCKALFWVMGRPES